MVNRVFGGSRTYTMMSLVDQDDLHWMQCAYQLADKAAALGEVPVGAVIVRNGVIIGQGFNQPISSCDPTAHAEVVALRDAAANEQNYRLVDSTLYVTLEPCTMCVGALIHARVQRVVFGASEPKAGAMMSRAKLHEADYLNHHIDMKVGVLASECSHQLSAFFERRRAEKRAAKLAITNGDATFQSDEDVNR